MKSEERHQLLANDLGVATTKSVGFLERHLGTTIAVICAALVLGGIGYFFSRSSVGDNSAGWTLLDAAKTVEDFGDVADKYKGKPPGQWAILQIAEKNLQNAMPAMFTDREVALTDLKRAREGFDTLIKDTTAPSVIRERALWGLALCLESGCDGDTSKPIAAFKSLLSEFPDTMFRPVAEERIASLEKAGAAEFYAWFAKEKPMPPEVRPRDGKPDNPHFPLSDPFGGEEVAPQDQKDKDIAIPKEKVIEVNPPATDDGAGKDEKDVKQEKTPVEKEQEKTPVEKE